MSTMAALLDSGMSSELRNPLGTTMVGGLLLSQLLTLLTTPAIYMYFGPAGTCRAQAFSGPCRGQGVMLEGGRGQSLK